MSFSEDDFAESLGGAALAGQAGAARASAAPTAPRVVTTGRKNTTNVPHCVGSDADTGEPVQLFATARGYSVTRHLVPVEPIREGVALFDALAFSIVPPDEKSYDWVLREMAQFLEISDLEHRRGLFGFKFSARFGGGAGIVAWGGESQRGRVYFSLMGTGCSMVTRWADLALWLEQHRATIKRADLAYDDFAGRLVSIAWAIEQYRAGGFNAGGRKPIHTCYGDWLEGESSTIDSA